MVNGPSIVKNGRTLPVHQAAGTDDPATESRANTLMAQAYPQDGNRPGHDKIASWEMPASCGVQGPGEMTDMLRFLLRDGLEIDLVIPVNLAWGSQFPQILNQVVGKGIVIVDHKDHGSPSSAC